MNVQETLIARLQARADFGMQKYGKLLEPWNGRNPAIDAMEELLDLFVYLEQFRMEREQLVKDLRHLERADVNNAWWIRRQCGGLADRLSQDIPRIGYSEQKEELS